MTDPLPQPDPAPPDTAAPAATGPAAELWRAVEEHVIRYGGVFAPVFIARAEGAFVYDLDGRAILDFTSGQMCATLGHGHPDITAAIQQALGEVVHLFSGMLSPPVVELCRALAGLLPLTLAKALLVSTGGESTRRRCAWRSSIPAASRWSGSPPRGTA